MTWGFGVPTQSQFGSSKGVWWGFESPVRPPKGNFWRFLTFLGIFEKVQKTPKNPKKPQKNPKKSVFYKFYMGFWPNFFAAPKLWDLGQKQAFLHVFGGFWGFLRVFWGFFEVFLDRFWRFLQKIDFFGFFRKSLEFPGNIWPIFRVFCVFSFLRKTVLPGFFTKSGQKPVSRSKKGLKTPFFAFPPAKKVQKKLIFSIFPYILLRAFFRKSHFLATFWGANCRFLFFCEIWRGNPRFPVFAIFGRKEQGKMGCFNMSREFQISKIRPRKRGVFGVPKVHFSGTPKTPWPLWRGVLHGGFCTGGAASAHKCTLRFCVFTGFWPRNAQFCTRGNRGMPIFDVFLTFLANISAFSRISAILKWKACF